MSSTTLPTTDPNYIVEAMDYIIEQSHWANTFPRECLERIQLVCEAVKDGKPLPFKNNKS